MTQPMAVPANLFREIAEYTYDWETWVDGQGRMRWINAAVTRITGYSVDECLALPEFPLALAHPADREILARVLEDARAGGSGNDVEFRVCTKDGAERWVAISWQSVRPDQESELGYRTSIRDIDERKHMEDALHRFRQRAEALAQARSELLANVSHELRTPAHCISGFAELMLRGALDDKQRRYATLILEQSRSMQRQVEDLLSLAALEAGGVELVREPVDLPSLAQGLIEAAQARAGERGLTLRSELSLREPLVLGDGLRLTQVLRNLIDNALKFTERGSITLRITQQAAPRRLVCEVIDTGVGMDPSQIETLLQPFRQDPASAAQRHGGVGLGLAIVRRMVEAMGGELSIESRLGSGTQVRVSLPWEHVETPGQAQELPERTLGPGRALVVDDTGPARELLAGLLASCGFDAGEAESADVACQLAAGQPFDVAFVDYHMPGCDGIAAAQRLRRLLRSESGRHVPIYLLTANVFVHEQLGAARGAVEGILSKPLSRAALVRVLSRTFPEARPPQSDAQPAVLSDAVVEDLLGTRARSGGSMLHKLLPGVERDMNATLATAQEQLVARAGAALGRTAHALAGHASLVGAQAATEAAQRLELLLEDAEAPVWDEAARLLARCAERWALAHDALVRRMAELDKS